VQRFDESRALLAECKAVFHDYGDDRLYLFCGVAEGILLYRLRLFREAYDIFLPLLETATQSQDVETEARIQNNAGRCLAELGQFSPANIHLSRAIAAFTELGRTVEAIRTEMSFGRLLVARGAMTIGMQRLHDARRSFLMHEMIEDAGICGLVLVEAYLIMHRLEDAARLARQIAQQFITAGLNQRAQVALSYLRETLEKNTASAEIVRHVHDYIIGLRSQPTREFVAF
jgi:tetratricopeptide (TPR) repeat protein